MADRNMENDLLHESLICELNKGKELTKDLAKQLRETSSSNNSERLVGNILSSYNEALLILSGRATQEQCQTVISSSSDPPSSSISLCNVTQSKDSSSGSLERRFGDYGQTIIEGAPDRDQSKDSSSALLKRKARQDTRTVKINEKAGDEYYWRKYAQKEMPGFKYPRSYHRCAFRHSLGCLATKIEQRSDEDLTISDVTYRGVHTCLIGERSTIA